MPRLNLASRARRAVGQPPSRPRRAARFLPASEPLEGRALLSTLEVNADPADTDAYHTISAAAAVAKAGDTIEVAPGTYADSAKITTPNLTIVGKPTDSDDPRKGTVIIEPPAGSPGIDVEAARVTITGITVQGAMNAPGIELGTPSSGSRLENDVLQNNTFGLFLNSNGKDQTVITHDQFVTNNAPGAASGNGIYSDQGASNITIDHNTFTGDDNAAVLFAGGPGTQSNLKITNNVMTNDSAIILANTTQAEVSNNTNVGSNGYGVFLPGGDSFVTVKNNTLSNGAFSGVSVDARPDFFNLAPGATNHDLTINNNTITGFTYDGVTLAGGAYNVSVNNNTTSHNGRNGISLTAGAVNLASVYNNSVSNNTANNNGQDGISLTGGAHDNTVNNNTADHNKRYGIFAGSTTSDNTFRNNSMHGNTAFDADDNSHGTGTAGTANFWVNNSCDTANPPGICTDHGHGKGHGGNDDNDGGDDNGQGEDNND